MSSFYWPTLATASTITWTSYTPILSNYGTPTNINFRWAQSGNLLLISGSFTCGTNPGGVGIIGLPTGFVAKSDMNNPQNVGYIACSVKNLTAWIFLMATPGGGVLNPWRMNLNTFGASNTTDINNNSNLSLFGFIPL